MAVEQRTGNSTEHRRHHKGNRREHKKNSGKRPRPVASFLRNFWFEITALGILTLGLFLLIEKLQIKAIVARTFMQCAGVVIDMGSRLWNVILQILQSVEQSDLIGIVLILIALSMVAYRLRSRAIQRRSDLALNKECPQCHENLRRMPRKLMDRLLELILWIRIRRYHCGKCSFRVSAWKGRRESE